MNYQYLFLIIFLFFSGSCSAFPFDSLYAKIFGEEPVSEYYSVLLKQALRDFGCQDCDDVPLYKMNSRASTLIGSELYSFTLTGIWINEPVLQNCSEHQKYFILYHEAAHYAHHHHAKALVALLLTVSAAVGLNIIVHTQLKSAFGTLASLVFSIAGSYWLLKSIIKEQEQSADLAAAQLLCQLDKAIIVQHHLDSLIEQINEGEEDTDSWHYPISEQFANIFWYLQSIGISCSFEEAENNK
jgi:Zn-dependent protease with chaperone function